jgi:ABC-2 type transport system permease protein
MARAHPIATIVGKDFRQMWRDRSAVVLIFVMPLVLAGITTLAFGPLDRGTSVKIGVVNLDHGAAARVLITQVLPGLQGSQRTPLVALTSYPTAAQAESATENGKEAASIVVPAGFSAAVQANQPSRLQLLTGDPDGIGVPVATAVLTGFAAQTGSNELSIVTATTGPGAATRTTSLVTAATAQRSPVVIATNSSGIGTLSAASYFAPSMLVLALFFCGVVLARGLVAERRSRTMARILLAGTKPSMVLLAKFLVALGVGLLSAAVVLGAFAAAGVRLGNWPALCLLVLLAAVAMISTASLAVLVSRNEEQAGTIGTVTVFVLAILGGNFVPLSQSGGPLSTLSLFTPNGWAVHGFANLAVATSDPIRAILPQLLALVAFALITGLPTVLLARRSVEAAGV